MSQKTNGKTSQFENSEFSGTYKVRKNDLTNGHIQDPDVVISNESPTGRSKTVVRQDTNDSKVDEAPDISCGIGSLRTSIFGSSFANLYVFSICFALSNFFTSMVEQVISVQLTSLERQFNIDNARAGLFQTASRVGFMSTVLFAGHFAKKSHIPLIIGICGVLQGFFLTIPAIMQLVDPFELPLLSPSGHSNSSNSTRNEDNLKYLCHPPVNGTSSKNDTNSTAPGEIKQIQFIVVLVVEAVKGVTDTFHNGFLPTLYMDDNLLDKSKMGILLGIQQVISELAGPIGKQINGLLTKIPIDLKDTDMDPGDKRFVSAWWLAFLIFGLGTAVFSLPIMVFPRKLISSRQRQEALDKAVVTFAGGAVEDEVAEENNDTEESEPQRKPEENEETSPPDFSENTRRHYSQRNRHVRNDSRKGSSKRKDSSDTRYSGSRRPSLFPPVIGPTERKVSIAGDLVFEQPIKEPGKKVTTKDMLKDFPKALVRVLRKPVFVLLLVDVVIISVPISGTSIFRNAYMANEYNVPMSDVALVSGITTALGHIFGTLFSSWVSSRVKTKMGYMYIISCTYFLTLIVIPFYFIIGCDNEVVYGSTSKFGHPLNGSECGCTQSNQLISCGSDGRNYFSPCYAGCEDVQGKEFIACSLLNSTVKATLTPGLCHTDCRTNFILYASLHGMQNFFAAMAMIPRRLLILRIVDPQDRGFATSLFMFFFVFVAIPSPNLFGKVIDNTCLIWDSHVCSLYDRDAIRYLMSGIDIGVHGCVQITFIIMLCIFKWEERRDRKKAKKEAAEKDTESNVVAGDL